MQTDDIIQVGRMLCYFYYNRSLEKTLKECVEKPLVSKKRGRLGETWLQLLSGDLANLTQGERARVLGSVGGGAWRDRLSVDGNGFVREMEIQLYLAVGMELCSVLRLR